MDQIYERVAGLDVHRDNVVACFRRLGLRGGVVFEKDRFATTTAGLRVLEEWLSERQVDPSVCRGLPLTAEFSRAKASPPGVALCRPLCG